MLTLAMTICAQCGHENEDGASFCAECTAPLELEGVAPVDLQLTAPGPDPDFNLVIVAKFARTAEANLLKLRLESAGIQACIPEPVTAPASPTLPTSPVAQVTVRVATQDYAAAVQVMQQAPGTL